MRKQEQSDKEKEKEITRLFQGTSNGNQENMSCKLVRIYRGGNVLARWWPPVARQFLPDDFAP